MKCIGKYSKLIAVLSLTAMVTTGCGFGSKNVVADYEIENYNKNLYTDDLFASDLCVASGDVNLKGITSAETDTLHSAALFDVDGKKVDFSYQMFDKIYPASTTKLMTALVALENADLSDVVTVSQNADMNSFAADEATCGIQAGDKITLSDLLYGLLLHSGNDNATAIAEYVGGSMDGFAKMMNKEAKKLMATGTHFVNSNGLHNDDHYTTAYDLYLIFNECIKNDDFVKIIKSKSHTAKVTGSSGAVRSITWEPTNFYATGEAKKPDNVTVIGGKTGTTKLAGNCLSHIRTPEHGRVGDGIAHFAAGMVGEIAHRVERLLGGAGGDENPKALKILLTGENGLNSVIDVVRLGHFSLAHCAAGEMAGQRLHDDIAPLPQHGEILLGGGIFVHIGVHGGHQQLGAGAGQCGSGQKIVGQPPAELGDDIGRSRGNDQQVGLTPEGKRLR